MTTRRCVMAWVFMYKSYRAVFEEVAPDLHREASSSITGYAGVNNRGVDQCGEVGADRGQMTTVCKP